MTQGVRPGGRRYDVTGVTRRSFVVHASRNALGIAVVALVGCSARDPATDVVNQDRSGTAAGLAWRRVDLAYVSAYVLVRGDVAAVIDTGFPDSADQIGAALNAAGPGWRGVRDIVVTHAHPDHFGGVEQVADRAATATVHVGARDLDEVRLAAPAPFTPSPGASPTRRSDFSRRLHAVADGDDVFGLQVVATPGHTPGHVAVFDVDSAVLVAGDALTNTVDGLLRGALPLATQDEKAAAGSVRKLAALEPHVILVGHGPPVVQDAATKLRRLASSLA